MADPYGRHFSFLDRHNVTTLIENVTEHEVIASGAFLDIEGAFNRTSSDNNKIGC
jgi:hypothetical protein